MRIAFFLALCAGCFNPKYGSETFYCHADDNPACPDGQFCVDGRCQATPGGGNVILDGGTTFHQDFGGGLQPMDLSMGGNPFPSVDLSMPPQNQMNGCHGLIQCLVACTTTSCESACNANATTNAQTLEMNAVGCGQDYCVNTSFECMDDGTGHLVDAAGAPPGSCNNCLNNALAALTSTACSPANDPDCNPSQCTSQTNACVSNLP
jgi:hypothetical protein